MEQCVLIGVIAVGAGLAGTTDFGGQLALTVAEMTCALERVSEPDATCSTEGGDGRDRWLPGPPGAESDRAGLLPPQEGAGDDGGWLAEYVERQSQNEKPANSAKPVQVANAGSTMTDAELTGGNPSALAGANEPPCVEFTFVRRVGTNGEGQRIRCEDYTTLIAGNDPGHPDWERVPLRDQNIGLAHIDPEAAQWDHDFKRAAAHGRA